jgi:DNA invertase Pin-like site-specific DNA recombinase
MKRKLNIMKIGYARVSTEDQKLDLQLAALKKAGCERIFTDHGMSGSGFERPGLEKVLDALEQGDTLIVWRLDRLGRSLAKLIQLVDALGKRGIEFHSLTESIDTSSSGGRLVFHMMAALAEFERSLISERTKAGMEAARLKGQHLGRPRGLTETQVQNAILAVRDRGEEVSAVASELGVTTRSLRRMMQRAIGEHVA